METQKLYYCQHCNKFVPYEEIIENPCPWCLTPMRKHKKCGGKVTLK
jgi:methionyl-tRNA synthetase